MKMILTIIEPNKLDAVDDEECVEVFGRTIVPDMLASAAKGAVPKSITVTN